MSTTAKSSGSRRFTWLDLAKGIGILAVVWSHAKGPFSSYLYQFHMPLFFLISGFLYNEQDSLRSFSRKRFFNLYVPFVFWNVLVFAIRYYTQYRPCTVNYFRKSIYLVLLTLDKNAHIFGPTWFLGSLFVVSILYKLFDLLLKRLHAPRILLNLMFILLGVLSFQFVWPYNLHRTGVLALFYAAGDLVRVYRLQLRRFATGWTALEAFLIFVLIGSKNSVNMGANRYTSPFLFVIGALLMSYALCWFCWRVDQFHRPKLWEYFRRLLVLFGERSMDLLIWHYLFFRVITVVQAVRWNLPIWDTILEHYPVFVTVKIWWLLYFLAASFLPLLWGDILRFGPWGKLFKKLHIV